MFGHHAPLFVFSHIPLASIYCTNCQLSRTSNSFSQGNIHERHDQTGNTDVLNPADLHPFCGMLSCAMHSPSCTCATIRLGLEKE
jgi:hypothetical protein